MMPRLRRGSASASAALRLSLLALGLLLCLAAGPGLRAAAPLPALTGRVVDAAHILSAGTIASLTGKLADLDAKSGIQLVVATLPSLGGEEIGL